MKTVLITGGSRGIGSELVRAFSKNGYNVAFTYRSSKDEAEKLAGETGALALMADSRSEEDVLSAVSKVIATYGQVDCLINNAAISSFSLFTDITGEEWNRFLSTNLSAPFFCAREVVRDMLTRKSGRIINVSSMWGQVGASCEVHYSAAKAGLIGLTRALAKELAPSGITVNCIAPGAIDTKMNFILSDDDKSAFAEEIPAGRFGTPDEIAGIVSFLAGKDSSYITAQTIVADGGLI
jgi:3-oxoacyl-[acyl-carrier protein] reductase